MIGVPIPPEQVIATPTFAFDWVHEHYWTDAIQLVLGRNF